MSARYVFGDLRRILRTTVVLDFAVTPDAEIVVQMERGLPSGRLHTNRKPQEREDLVIAGTHALESKVEYLGRASEIGEKARYPVLALSLPVPRPDGLGIDCSINVVGNPSEDRLDIARAKRFVYLADSGEVVLCCPAVPPYSSSLNKNRLKPIKRRERRMGYLIGSDAAW